MAIQPIVEGDNAARAKTNAAIAKANEVDGKASIAALAAESAARFAHVLAEAQARQSGDDALTAAKSTRAEANDDQIGPGEFPALWTSDVLAASPDPAPLASNLAVTSVNGRAIRAVGSLTVGPKRLVRIEAGRTYLARFAVQREANSNDPSNDGVRLAVLWFSASKAFIGSSLVSDLLDLTVASGRQSISATMARAAGAGIDFVAPAGARYARPYVQCFGNGAVTDIEVVDMVDVTDSSIWSPDVSAFNTRLTAVEGVDPGGRLDDIEAILDAPNTKAFRTRGDAEAATVPATVNVLRIFGRALAGDAFDALYELTTGDDYDIQTSNGKRFIVRGPVIDPRAVGDNDDPNTLLRAIDRTPLGGVLRIPFGNWRSPGLVERDDIIIAGGGMPVLAGDERSLIQGTVIKGSFHISGSRVQVLDLGVDAGYDFVTAHNAGTPTDAFVVTDADIITSGQVHTSIIVKNVAGLCKASDSPFHAVLLQGISEGFFDNVRGSLGLFGVVVKASETTARRLYGYKNGNACVMLKSDSYALSNNLVVSNVGGLGVAATEAVVAVHAATASMDRLLLSSVQTVGGKVGLVMIGSPRPAVPGAPEPDEFPNCALSAPIVSDVNILGASDFGMRTQGALIKTKISSVTAEGTTSGRGFQLGLDCLGAEIDGVYVSATVDMDDAIYLGGRFTATNLVAVVGNDFASKAGIALAGEDTAFRIGTYRGRLNLNADSDNLSYGWTALSGSSPRAVLENNRVTFAGCVVPPVRNDANNACMTLPVPPPVNLKVMATGFDAAGKGYPVLATISAGGWLYFDAFTAAGHTSGAFPNTINYVSLDGISYEI